MRLAGRVSNMSLKRCASVSVVEVALGGSATNGASLSYFSILVIYFSVV